MENVPCSGTHSSTRQELGLKIQLAFTVCFGEPDQHQSLRVKAFEFFPDSASATATYRKPVDTILGELVWGRDVDSNRWLGFQELVLGHTR
jgi:hypothetical protein